MPGNMMLFCGDIDAADITRWLIEPRPCRQNRRGKAPWEAKVRDDRCDMGRLWIPMAETIADVWQRASL